MNEEIARTVAQMIKAIFYLALGLFIYYFVPPEVWIWIKLQTEWGLHQFGFHTGHLK